MNYKVKQINDNYTILDNREEEGIQLRVDAHGLCSMSRGKHPFIVPSRNAHSTCTLLYV